MKQNIEQSNKDKKNSKLKKSIKVLIAIIITIVLMIYFVISYGKDIVAKRLYINEYNLKSSKITEEYHGLKIVHISDIHYGNSIKEKELNELIKKINLTKPDIVIFTGDLVDKDAKIDKNTTKILSESLKSINASIGKYAIKGDNDYSFDKWDLVIENSDFTDLKNEYDLIYNKSNSPILITGMSSNLKDKNSLKEKLNDSNTYLETNTPIYSILIMHEADYVDDIDSTKYDLILAGHTLGGEIKLPIIGALNYPKKGKKYTKNYYLLDNTIMYVSNGIGTTKNSIRLNNNPSFNLYRLIKK